MPWIINKSIKRENRKETEEDPTRQNKQTKKKECCSGSQEIKSSNRSKTTNQSLSQVGTGENPPLDLAPWWSWVFSGDSVCCLRLGGNRRRRIGNSSRDDSFTKF